MDTIVTATQALTIVTLVVAIISMVLSCMALWPQWKDRLATVRDTVLWVALVVVVVASVALGWRRVTERPSPSYPASHETSVDQLTADYPR